MQDIEYSAPQTVDEAVELLGVDQSIPRILAGGTDLLIQLRAGVRPANHLIDIKHIDEMNILQADPQEGLRIGAAVSCALLLEHPTAGQLYPGLVEAAALIGSDQIQNRATIAGNLCNGSPAADTTPPLLALGARCIVAGPEGRRELGADEIVVSPGTTSLSARELVVEIRVPPPPPRTADAYQRLIPRNEMDIAVVGVGAQLTVDKDGTCSAARIALGAVGPKAFVAQEATASLIGQPMRDDSLDRVAQLAATAAQPISDKRGTAEYRRDMVEVMTRRVLTLALQRCTERS